MELLTEAQFVIGLAMMAADVASGLSRTERRAVVHHLRTAQYPPDAAGWRERVQHYLDQRRMRREEASYAPD